MYPWFFVWSPQYYFPWSGAVTQEISPDAFFGAIPPEAGDGKTEQEVFNQVSYGRQLGALTDAVLMLLGKEGNQAATSQEAKAIEPLRLAAEKIEVVKNAAKLQHQQRDLDDAINALHELKQRDPQQLQCLLAQLQTP